MADVVLLNCQDYQADRLAAAFDEGAALLGGWERFARPPLLQGFDVPRAVKVGAIGGKAFGAIISLLKKRPSVDLSACTDCRTCVESCPVGAIDRSTKSIDYSRCIECLCCHELCMQEAVELRHANRLMAFLNRKRARAVVE